MSNYLNFNDIKLGLIIKSNKIPNILFRINGVPADTSSIVYLENYPNSYKLFAQSKDRFETFKWEAN